MKRTIQTLIVAALAVCAGLSSCKKSSDTPSEPEKGLAGSVYVATLTSLMPSFDGTTLQNAAIIIAYKFDNDKDVTMEANFDGVQMEKVQGTYAVQGNELSITAPGESGRDTTQKATLSQDLASFTMTAPGASESVTFNKVKESVVSTLEGSNWNGAIVGGEGMVGAPISRLALTFESKSTISGTITRGMSGTANPPESISFTGTYSYENPILKLVLSDGEDSDAIMGVANDDGSFTLGWEDGYFLKLTKQ